MQQCMIRSTGFNEATRWLCSGGLIVYRIQLPINASGPLRLGQANTLDFKVTPHDYVHVRSLTSLAVTHLP